MNLTDEDFQLAAETLDVELNAIKAVAMIESGGNGFNPDGSLKILFEGHHFSRYTKGIYDNQYPNISYKVWDKTKYGNYKKEHDRLSLAVSLDEENAYKSASFGMFQILGSNHSLCNFDSATDLYYNQCISEVEQLNAFVMFILNTNLDNFLKKKDFKSFARYYNGPAYAKNQYDIKIKNLYDKLNRTN